MTALFRAPDMDSARRPQVQALPVIQKKEEQESLVDVPVVEVKPALPVSTVTRQVAPPLASMPKPLPPFPSTPAESEPAKMPDPVWKRLQTIFRKHQEDDNPPAADTTDMDAGMAASIQRQVQEKKDSELPQAISRDEHPLPVQTPTAISSSSSMVVQRFSENVKGPSANIVREAPFLSSTTPETTGPVPSRNTEFKPASLNITNEVHAEIPVDEEPEKPSLPLESAWNVQRLEASHPLFRENIPELPVDSRAEDKNETSIETAPISEQKPDFGPIQLHWEGRSTAETQTSDAPQAGSREPVEILSPSRPRPPQTDIPPQSISIQRQSEDSHAAKEIGAAAPVNTAIGPLPADLWWLLGQKTPPETPVSQPAIQRAIHSDQIDQSKIINSSQTPAAPSAEPIPGSGTIQREVLSRAPLPSSQQELVRPPRAEESKPAETPDLDDLARRVYAEVRRRLAAEWERRR